MRVHVFTPGPTLLDTVEHCELGGASLCNWHTSVGPPAFTHTHTCAHIHTPQSDWPAALSTPLELVPHWSDTLPLLFQMWFRSSLTQILLPPLPLAQTDLHTHMHAHSLTHTRGMNIFHMWLWGLCLDVITSWKLTDENVGHRAAVAAQTRMGSVQRNVCVFCCTSWHLKSFSYQIN